MTWQHKWITRQWEQIPVDNEFGSVVSVVI